VVEDDISRVGMDLTQDSKEQCDDVKGYSRALISPVAKSDDMGNMQISETREEPRKLNFGDKHSSDGALPDEGAEAGIVTTSEKFSEQSDLGKGSQKKQGTASAGDKSVRVGMLVNVVLERGNGKFVYGFVSDVDSEDWVEVQTESGCIMSEVDGEPVPKRIPPGDYHIISEHTTLIHPRLKKLRDDFCNPAPVSSIVRIDKKGDRKEKTKDDGEYRRERKKALENLNKRIGITYEKPKKKRYLVSAVCGCKKECGHTCGCRRKKIPCDSNCGCANYGHACSNPY
jgi:hypothetical protein